MIVVATRDFEVYHDLVTSLRDRGVRFTTVEPEGDLPPDTAVVLTGPDDAVEPPAEAIVVRAEPGDPRPAIEAALAHLRDEDGRTVIGIDPGDRPGIAVLAGDAVIAAYHVPEARVSEVVAEEIEGAPDPLVRIGDGARVAGGRIVADLPSVPVELVDETGTTPFLGTGARGMGDVLAAVNIARRAGDRIESREITPTAGELQRIKERSRAASETNRAIDDDLARRVAAGDLSVEEALLEHRE